MKTYSEKLRDPRWQKKRLELLNAADWKCEACGNKKKTLEIHHCFYERGKMPWDYPDFCFMCLCETCHEERQKLELSIQKEIAHLNYDDAHSVYSDILRAIHLHGIKKLSDFCKSLDA